MSAHHTLVGPADLEPHLDDPSWVVVDCRFDLTNEAWGAEQYALGHIPGAVYAHLGSDLSGEKTGANGRHPLPSVEAMTATFTRFGIGPDTQVICYDQDSGMYAARLWWMLRYLGHERVAVLDGGLARWIREARTLASDVEWRPAGAFVAVPRPEMLRTVDDVQAAGGVLIDARAPERYEGRTEPLDRVAGHIPGARNHFFKLNLRDDLTLQPTPDLRALFTATLRGTTPDAVTMYCGSGVTACHNLLAMEHVGLRGARLYLGSWSEWSADPARPVEQGPDRA